MSLVTCPVCRKRFEADASETMPFCGSRCRQIDLGRWVSENYSVPSTRLDDDGEELPPDEDSR